MAVVWVLALVFMGSAEGCPAEPAPKPSQSCHEEDSCWDCHTMGNKVCGPGERVGKA